MTSWATYRSVNHLSVEVLGEEQVLLGKASSHLLLLLQPTHQLKLLLGQVINVLLQLCEIVGFCWDCAIDQTLSQGCMRSQTCSRPQATFAWSLFLYGRNHAFDNVLAVVKVEPQSKMGL